MVQNQIESSLCVKNFTFLFILVHLPRERTLFLSTVYPQPLFSSPIKTHISTEKALAYHMLRAQHEANKTHHAGV